MEESRAQKQTLILQGAGCRASTELLFPGHVLSWSQKLDVYLEILIVPIVLSGPSLQQVWHIQVVFGVLYTALVCTEQTPCAQESYWPCVIHQCGASMIGLRQMGDILHVHSSLGNFSTLSCHLHPGYRDTCPILCITVMVMRPGFSPPAHL